MKRRVVGVALFCLVLLAAIFAGYWDMLSTERTRLAGEEAAEAERGRAVETRALADAGAPPAAVPAAPSGSALPQNPVSAAPAAPAAEAAPSFDVLRVEPDGSTVMAGKAPAGATVRLTDGKSVLGEETSGPGGDFAIVLDKPLPVGEHQIRIEATGADGTASISRETAIVSVPERGKEDELLAMVETPDRPSRLISVPKGETPAGAPAASASGETKAPAASETPAAPGGGTSAPSAPGETAAAPDAGTTPPSAPGDEAAASPETGLAAAPSAAEEKPAGTGNLVVPSPFAVEAVEIEDETIYVAGRAPPGPTIRVYVDNVFLAEDAGRKTDRFLVSTRSPVTTGQHMVRADQIAADGTVIARVEVPFLKPEGRSMSAVASATEMPGAPEAAPTPAEPPAAEPPAEVASSSVAPPGGETPGTPPPEPRPTAEATPTPAPEVSAEQPDVAVSQDGGATAAPSPSDADLAAARQEPLKATGARVIIRRGDTLWRISREAYGRGARYTTIYLANGDQIRDPNRIYPGQVFRMPETAAQ